MSERKKIGVRVDEETYERFRKFVEERHGRIRGVLGRELENAMQERMSASTAPEPLHRIENDVATIKAMLAEAEGDGGAATPSTPETTDTHTSEPSSSESNSDPDDPPHGRATRREKAEWLAAQCPDDENVHRERDLADTVRRVYSFTDDTTEALVEATLDRLHHVPHPSADGVFMPPEDAEELRADIRRNKQADATERMDELDTGNDDTTPAE